MALVEVTALTKSFGSRLVWSNVSFAIQPGESIAIVGASGSGKSTLLNCIGLLDRADSGTVRIGGREITSLRSGGRRRMRRDLIGYVFQNYALVDNATAAYNLDLAAARIRRRDRADAVSAALGRVGLPGREDAKVIELSGGEQQRLALARIAIKRPSLILADEPTAALDSANARHIMVMLREFTSQGCGLIVTTHSEEVAAHCDTVLDLTRTVRRAPQARGWARR